MGIFSRLGDIINANLNSVLEKAEDPEKMIRLMIQEMEDTLVEIRSATAKCIAEKKERARLLKRLEQQKIDWAQGGVLRWTRTARTSPAPRWPRRPRSATGSNT